MNLIEGPIKTIDHSFWRDLWVAAFTHDQRTALELLAWYTAALLTALAIWQFTNFAVSKGAARMKINANYIWTLLTIAILALVAASAGAQETITSTTVDMGSLSRTTITTSEGIYTATTMDFGHGLSRSTIDVDTWDEDDSTLKTLLFIETQKQAVDSEEVDRWHVHSSFCDHDD